MIWISLLCSDFIQKGGEALACFLAERSERVSKDSKLTLTSAIHFPSESHVDQTCAENIKTRSLLRENKQIEPKASMTFRESDKCRQKYLRNKRQIAWKTCFKHFKKWQISKPGIKTLRRVFLDRVKRYKFSIFIYFSLKILKLFVFYY